MKLIKTDSQKEHLSKFLQDMAKAIIVVMVIAPLVKEEPTQPAIYLSGGWTALLLFGVGYFLESHKVEK